MVITGMNPSTNLRRTCSIHYLTGMNSSRDYQKIARQVGGVAPPPAEATTVRKIIEEHGEPYTAHRLGIGRSTIIRLAGGMTCRRGSILMAAHALGIQIDGGPQ